MKQLWDVGLQEYVHDMWNVIDFITNSLYVATVALRVVSYFQVSNNRTFIVSLPYVSILMFICYDGYSNIKQFNIDNNK